MYFQMATALLSTVLCNKCDNHAAKFHCNTCGDALCATCKENHLASKGTRHHVIVSYAKKLDPKYLIGLICHTHNTSDPELWCDTCGVPICFTCITEKHRGHEVSKITSVLSQKRDAMLEEVKSFRDKTVEKWSEVLQQAQNITSNYQAKIDEIDKDLQTRAQEMHRQVDAILSHSQRALQQMKISGLDKLQKQEKYIGDRLQQLREDVTKYEDQLTGADQNAVLQFKPGKIPCKEEPPSLEAAASIPAFAKGENDAYAMQKIFGELSNEDKDTLKKSPQSLSSTQLEATSDSRESKTKLDSGETMMPLSPSSTRSSAMKKSLDPNPSVQSDFYVNIHLPHIACVRQELAWVKTEEKKLKKVSASPNWTSRSTVKVQLVDRNGTVRDTINTDFDINGMTVTADGELLMTDGRNKCIRSVSISTLFNTSWKPYGLCCLHNKDIVVTFRDDCKVVVYSRNGEIRQKMDHIKFRHPMSVAVNKVNQDIYVCDHKENNRYSAGKVVTIAADGQLRYEYAGQGGKEFAPVDVCTDEMGHVLITDLNNHRVHILDQEGQFIQYILTSQQGLNYPTTIDVNQEGYVWVGEYFNECVKVTRYLQ